jgi:hypothetical protein
MRRLFRLLPGALLCLVATPVSAATNLSHTPTETIGDVIGDWLTYGFFFAAILFVIYMVWNLAQAHFATMMNVSHLRAAAIEQACFAVILLAIAASAKPISDSIGNLMLNAGRDYGSVQTLIIGLAQFALSLIFGLLIAFGFLAVIWSFVQAQANVYLGRPGGFSQSIGNLLAVVLGGITVFASFPFSNWILSVIAGSGGK